MKTILIRNAFAVGIGGVAIASASGLPFAQSVQAELPEQMPRWCKNEVSNRLKTYMADVTITNTQGTTVNWKVNSSGRTGKCLFNQNYQFVQLVVNQPEQRYRATGNIYWNAQARRWIAPDGGICNTCTPDKGFPIPPKTKSGFFYLPNERLWYDPSGAACNTCTPANGFPVPPR